MEVGTMKKTTDKRRKSIPHKIDELFTRVAFAEAGELYCHKNQKKSSKKRNNKHPLCVNGETSSGLCV
jgi:hypothetical protein